MQKLEARERQHPILRRKGLARDVDRESACTEFFDIDLKAIGEYLKAKFPGEVIEGSVSV